MAVYKEIGVVLFKIKQGLDLLTSASNSARCPLSLFDRYIDPEVNPRSCQISSGSGVFPGSGNLALLPPYHVSAFIKWTAESRLP